jgi:hypothetical protein
MKARSGMRVLIPARPMSKSEAVKLMLDELRKKGYEVFEIAPGAYGARLPDPKEKKP